MTVSRYEVAKQAGDEVAKTVHAIATLIGPQTDETYPIDGGGDVLPGLGMNEDAAALFARARDLSQGLFTITVVGEFKNGKSTLLNAMLGSKTLPAKAAPATAIITVLVHGDRKDVAVFETGRSEPRRLSWEDFVKEFQLNPQDQETIGERGTLDRFARIEYAEIECTHALCAQGVKLIDTPGLGEHISRTRVTTDFLKRSQAVIMVLNATRILTRDERAFIETTLGQGHLTHVFFVVNRINQVDPAVVDDIRDWVRSQLASHFQRDDGTLDSDLYERRVFFVNARGALDARSTVPQGVDVLPSTGLPLLEEELERFLAGGDKVAAALQSTVQFLRPVTATAQSRIEGTLAALDAPLSALEVRREEAEKHLQQLEGRKKEIEKTILLFGDAIKGKIYADLRAYVDEMHETWDEDSHRLMDLDSAVSLRNVIASYARPEARERMVLAISEEVQRYVHAKFEMWSDRIPSIIERDSAVLTAEVEAQIDDLELELDRIAAAFAGTTRNERDRSRGANLFQLALSLGDISGMTDEALVVADLTSVLARMIQQSIIVFIVGTLVRGSLIVTTIIVEAVQAGLRESKIKRRIRVALGERLTEVLREQVKDKQAFVYSAVEERFSSFAASATNVIGKQIDEIRADQERILGQKRDESFSVGKEKRRLVTIADELRRLDAVLRNAVSAPRLSQV